MLGSKSQASIVEVMLLILGIMILTVSLSFSGDKSISLQEMRYNYAYSKRSLLTLLNYGETNLLDNINLYLCTKNGSLLKKINETALEVLSKIKRENYNYLLVLPDLVLSDIEIPCENPNLNMTKIQIASFNVDNNCNGFQIKLGIWASWLNFNPCI